MISFLLSPRWSWSLFVNMDIQIPYLHVPSTILRGILIAILASTVLMTSSCYAFPLSSIPAPSHENAGYYDDSYRAGPSSDLHYLNTESYSRHPRLQSREIGWTKAMDRLSMKTDGMALVGFAYSSESDGLDYKGKFLPLELLILPDTARPFVTSDHLYLVSKLSLSVHDHPDHYWTCPVYAKKSRMVKKKPLMVFEVDGEPPAYPVPETFLPLYTQRPTENDADPSIDPSTINYRGTERIIFFEDKNIGVIMRIPTKEFSEKWNLKAECYQSVKHLQKTAKWNEIWKSQVHGWPQNLNIVG
ncbi:hypothetical protein GGU10DRAFT_363376 [Lentinula aff. detonsa]|uniref:Uncharacterized protein n=1 Tax=Lentinula aff. detonsa TaxID=2804958 RepID=A0AA38L2W3_9AGAR|nr:hypothetical protein GGU10DRAFT_363376 [Lentinula aff. detonsa]